MKRISPIYIGEILNLDKIQVYYEDQDPNSVIFGVSGIPSVISVGKHSFFINPTEGLEIEDENTLPHKLRLKKSTDIKLEIIDSSGKRIFYDFPNQMPQVEYVNGVRKLKNSEFMYGYYGPSGNEGGVAVTFNVDNSVEDGTGKIIVVGELEDVPSEWRGIYNVRWVGKITIQKDSINKSKIYFYKKPIVVIDEFVTPYYSQSMSAPTASMVVSGTYEVIKDSTPPPPTTYDPNAGGQNIYTDIGPEDENK